VEDNKVDLCEVVILPVYAPAKELRGGFFGEVVDGGVLGPKNVREKTSVGGIPNRAGNKATALSSR